MVLEEADEVQQKTKFRVLSTFRRSELVATTTKNILKGQLFLLEKPRKKRKKSSLHFFETIPFLDELLFCLARVTKEP